MLPLPRKRPNRKRRGPHPHRALSAAFCRNVGEAGRYCDGDGLYLHVETSGSRRWVQRLVIRGKSCTLGLGSYRLVSLAEARALALANRKVARSGGDPLADRRRTGGVPTFKDAAERVIAIYSEIWKDPEKMGRQWRGCLRDHAYTRIGDKGVDKVTSGDIMAVLLPLWARRHATARKLRQRIGAVMKWAVAQGYRMDNPTGEAITAALPKHANQVQHMPALPHGEVAGAVEAVRASSAWVGTKLCFEFMVLTAVRPGEARGTRWQEIDLGASVWTIPATRMKTSREHRVPLCTRAAEVLHEAARLRRGSTTAQPGGLVFPSARGKQLADARLSKLLEQLGIAAVPHGFRSSFRDWASERTDHPREVMEAALAHVVRNQTEAAYARSDLFDRRRQLMDDWMLYLDPERSPRPTGPR
ncbi:MAG: tyrosine-type recombinase/integrase [Acidobacteria bacterium]|nr:tyrosine-type recombinase/integrase [Acidobacteriota bacterium]